MKKRNMFVIGVVMNLKEWLLKAYKNMVIWGMKLTA